MNFRYVGRNVAYVEDLSGNFEKNKELLLIRDANCISMIKNCFYVLHQIESSLKTNLLRRLNTKTEKESS